MKDADKQAKHEKKAIAVRLLFPLRPFPSPRGFGDVTHA